MQFIQIILQSLFVPLISLFTAAIPLTLAILALRSNQTRKTKELLETQSFIVLNIKRLPIEDQIWKKIKTKNLLKLIMYIILLIFIAPILEAIIFASSINTEVLNVIYFLFFCANILLAIIYIILFRNSYIFRCRSAYQGRYAIFKEAQILIESDYRYLFNKCHEVLKIMGAQVIEVNFDAQLIDAFIPGTLFSRARSIVVRIQALEGKEGLYSVLGKASPFVKRENKDQISVSSEASSQVINRFINQLLSTTGSTKKKTKKEIEPA